MNTPPTATTAVFVAFALIPLASAAPTTQPASAGLYDVRTFGALGDGQTKDTAAIQRAIDAAADAGGGTVRFSPGRYLSGTLRLKSGVALLIDHAATLLGSTDLADFPEIVPALRSYTDTYTTRSLIYAENLTDIALYGQGTIDGQGAAPTFHEKSYKLRPYNIRMINCRDVRVEGLTLRNSPMWMEHYLACENLTIRGIRVYNQVNGNNDMMDIDGCRNVVISDCFGDTEDDGITLKSTLDRPTENVAITNCVLSSCCNAIKCGTESNGGFRNITISNCTIKPTTTEKLYWDHRIGLSGIALETVDGGIIDGITISNISIRGTTAPIFMRLGNRARPFREGGPVPSIGQFRNVTISNVEATGAADMACSITGLPGHPIENVTLDNVRLSFAGGRPDTRPASEIPEQAQKYPEGGMFGPLPAYGLYVRHATGLTLRNVQFAWTKPDHRPALLCDDVSDLSIDTLRAQLSPQAPAFIVLCNTKDAMLRACRPPADAAAFLRVEGAISGITVFNNDFANIKTPILFGENVPPTAVHQTNNRPPEK